jgi:phage baseplate assembly protein W
LTWEPRIRVDQVNAVPDPSGSIRVEVAYTVVSTGFQDSLEQIVANTQR